MNAYISDTLGTGICNFWGKTHWSIEASLSKFYKFATPSSIIKNHNASEILKLERLDLLEIIIINTQLIPN